MSKEEKLRDILSTHWDENQGRARKVDLLAQMHGHMGPTPKECDSSEVGDFLESVGLPRRLNPPPLPSQEWGVWTMGCRVVSTRAGILFEGSKEAVILYRNRMAPGEAEHCVLEEFLDTSRAPVYRGSLEDCAHFAYTMSNEATSYQMNAIPLSDEELAAAKETYIQSLVQEATLA